MQLTGSLATSPIGVAATWISPWFPTDVLNPWISVSVSSDASGSLAIQESNQTDLNQTQIGGIGYAGGATAASIQLSVRANFFRLVYTNGAVAQTAFNVSLTASAVPGLVAVGPAGIPSGSGPAAYDALMLRELRTISMLLALLKEPTGLPPNIPFGLDVLAETGTIAGTATAAPPYGAPVQFD